LISKSKIKLEHVTYEGTKRKVNVEKVKHIDDPTSSSQVIASLAGVYSQLDKT
jgi:hypothetical protein